MEGLKRKSAIFFEFIARPEHLFDEKTKLC